MAGLLFFGLGGEPGFVLTALFVFLWAVFCFLRLFSARSAHFLIIGGANWANHLKKNKLMSAWLVVICVLLVIGCFVPAPLVRRISATILLLMALGALNVVSSLMLASWLATPGFYLAIIVFVCLYAISLLWVWKPWTPKARLVARLGALAILVAASAIIIGPRLHRDSFEVVGERKEGLKRYEPFIDGTLAADLGEPSSLKLDDNLPALDGATALYPVYAAFARAVYPQGLYRYSGFLPGMSDIEELSSPVVCNTTRQAFENLLSGAADIVFLAGLSEEQNKEAEARGIRLRLTPIGREAFVFFVNRRNPVDNLTIEQIKGVYSGRITNWREIGGARAKIKAYQRSSGSGSQSALMRLMGDLPVMEPPEEERFDLMGGIYRAVSDFRNYKTALGFSFRFYLTGMLDGSEIKLLSIDGIEPTLDAIQDGSYPLAEEFFAVTVDGPDDEFDASPRRQNAQKLIDWILSPQGQSLVAKTGYAPVARNLVESGR